MLATRRKDVDLIVELIGGAEGPAKKLAFNALKNKARSNQQSLNCKYGDKLSAIAEKNKVNLEFEASVCGGVPIIRSLKEGLIQLKFQKLTEFLMEHLITHFQLWINKIRVLLKFYRMHKNLAMQSQILLLI